MISGIALGFILGPAAEAFASSPASRLAQALHRTQASGVVMDIRTGAVVASFGPEHRGAPGSVIKPLLLAYGLEHHIVRAESEVYCRRKLHVGARSLPCTHPVDQPIFNAEAALAESCNTWFAELGRQFTGPQLDSALTISGLPHASLRQATADERELAVLGLEGVTASPLQLAHAYRAMLQRASTNEVVVRGLNGSVDYGMAHEAAVRDVVILGKTGTASNPGEAWTHGWFAGALPGRLVLVIYVPHGDGGTAAQLARQFFTATIAEDKER